jgi:hypothetical protein
MDEEAWQNIGGGVVMPLTDAEKQARREFWRENRGLLDPDQPSLIPQEILWTLHKIEVQTKPVTAWDKDIIDLGGGATIEARVGYADMEKVALIPLENWAHIKAILEGRTPPPDSMNESLTTQAREMAKEIREEL